MVFVEASELYDFVWGYRMEYTAITESLAWSLLVSIYPDGSLYIHNQSLRINDIVKIRGLLYLSIIGYLQRILL